MLAQAQSTRGGVDAQRGGTRLMLICSFEAALGDIGVALGEAQVSRRHFGHQFGKACFRGDYRPALLRKSASSNRAMLSY